jgi:hypothetical protein
MLGLAQRLRFLSTAPTASAWGLTSGLLAENIRHLKWPTPTKIQRTAIPLALQQFNVSCCCCYSLSFFLSLSFYLFLFISFFLSFFNTLISRGS